MNWIAILFAAELGVLPMGNFHLYEPAGLVESTGNYYADMGMRAILFDTIYLGGSMKAHFAGVQDTYMFLPSAMNYLFEAGIQRGGFSIGWRHYCAHPMVPIFSDASWDSGGYEEVFIRLEAQIGGKH
jgi:hypothetical protein